MVIEESIGNINGLISSKYLSKNNSFLLNLLNLISYKLFSLLIKYDEYFNGIEYNLGKFNKYEFD